MSPNGFDLGELARQEMVQEGFQPDFPPGTSEQLQAARRNAAASVNGDIRDLRNLLWSSIDNDTSRDLDQIEVAERTGDGIRLLIGIADVDVDVCKGSPLDTHAASQTTTVYTAVRVFPMLPEELSTNLTSLNEDMDRTAVVIEMVISGDGSITSSAIYRALVRNKAQLSYEGVGPWLEAAAPPPAKLASVDELQQQIELQDEAAAAFRKRRQEAGALNFYRVEAQPTVTGGQVRDIKARRKNKASALIEDLMVAANEVMAKTLTSAGVSAIRRVVKSPERWPRIVDLAAQQGFSLPVQPDSAALARFLQEQKQKDALHYPDLSLAVVKLMGPGEYVLARPGEEGPGHFGLAAHDYTHSTAPNRRFADLVTQRLIKSVLNRTPSPYSDEELAAIARNCTLREDAARKVERVMGKRAAAVAFQNRIGESFNAVVTGVTSKGTFVRVLDPPVEGRLMGGEAGMDVGDTVRVVLLSTDAQRGYIDFRRDSNGQ